MKLMLNPAYQISPRTYESPDKSLGYTKRDYPLAIKYMGSKAKILDFIKTGLDEIGGYDLPILDLFAGACSISGGFGGSSRIISNDIQEYSKAIAYPYLKRCSNIGQVDVLEVAKEHAKELYKILPEGVTYPVTCSLDEFNTVERVNQSLIHSDINLDYHLYTKYYSGTWWSAEQCVWIDSIRKALDDLYKAEKITEADFMLGLACLMHSMAYSSQGTGHYAQYRDAKTEASMKNINFYRQKDVASLFVRKLNSFYLWNVQNVVDLGHEVYALDYKDCLKDAPKSVVYADPPYALVHYSRFYHAIETLYKYDYPELKLRAGRVVKGRYREDRHQSPFCIRTQVSGAFKDMFEGIKGSESCMILSYSNTGMILLEELMGLAFDTFGRGYEVWFDTIGYSHMTMGRRADHSRQVQEAIILAKYKS